ncbi:MAG: O-antigen ligase family protein [Phycisphaerales bacterium JB052]
MPKPPVNPDHHPQSGIWGRFIGFAEGNYIDRDACNAAFDRMHRRDAIGDKIHLILGVGALICLFGPVTMTEIAILPLVAFFFIRVVNTLPIWIHGFGQPLILATLALIAFMFLALSWSPDRYNGLAEIGQLRWLFVMGFLFPIIEHRTTLVYALCIGLAMGQIGQVFDAFDGLGIEPVAKLVENHPGRIAGWWHPVVGGGLLVAGMGLHLPAAMLGTGRMRIIGLLGLTITGVGVLATGTRGAWGAALLLLVLGVVLVLRMKRVPIKRVIAVVALGLIAVATAGFVLRDSIMIRVNETRTELREIEAGDLDSYSGRRVRMAQEAIEAFAQHPIVGVGTGGYERWCEQQGQRFGAHAHNSTLHIGATLGIIGLMLWAIVLFVTLRNAWRWGLTSPANPYAMGPMLGITGLLLASLTDSVHINAQSVAMLGVLLALCPAYAPGTPSPIGDDIAVEGE